MRPTIAIATLLTAVAVGGGIAPAAHAAPALGAAAPARCRSTVKLQEDVKLVRPLSIALRRQKNAQVALVQQAMNATANHGARCLVVDGYYGPATQQAVIRAQRGLGYRQTGVVDARFWGYVFFALSGDDGQ